MSGVLRAVPDAAPCRPAGRGSTAALKNSVRVPSHPRAKAAPRGSGGPGLRVRVKLWGEEGARGLLFFLITLLGYD